MKISIITVVHDNARTIEHCINSVLAQTYSEIEYIVIDGGSGDGTVEIIKKYKSRIAQFISEPDGGLYDAMNKGLQLSSGELIGFLNSDDFYAHDRIVETVAEQISLHHVDSCYGDLVYVQGNMPDKIVRYWRAGSYRPGMFLRGWMPPHQTFFVKKRVYSEYGAFNRDFKIAADYELMLRFLERYGISTVYIPEVLVEMRLGGVSNSNLWNLFVQTIEDYHAWKVNSLKKRFYTIPLKKLIKIPQFFLR